MSDNDLTGNSYVTSDGRVVFVTTGISGGRSWFTGYRLPNGSLRRFTSPHLPLRPTMSLAQKDLNKLRMMRGWLRLETVKIIEQCAADLRRAGFG